MNLSTGHALRHQLLDRRERLRDAIGHRRDPESLVLLLAEVDSALSRIDTGTYGICEVCRDAIADTDLRRNPVMRYCLCGVSEDQLRALESDLVLARRIQTGLLPDPDVRAGGWEAHVRYEPAGAVSGDYCDVLVGHGDGPSVFFAVGDVSGKGVAASLIMAHLNAFFRAAVETERSLSRLVVRANSLLVESTLHSHFVTLVCGWAQPDGRVELCNAGHCAPLVIRHAATETLDSTEIPLGIQTGGAPVVRSLTLAPGESLLLYTDGLTEARNREDEEYGEERVHDVAGRHRRSSTRDLVRALRSDLESFLAGVRPPDDLSMMALQRAL